MILTYRYRIKSKSAERRLCRMARAVNFVWNYCGDVQNQAQKWDRKWPSRFDLIKLMAGSCQELGLAARTVEAVATQFVQSRQQHRKRPRWRGSRSLGWVPIAAAHEVLRVSGDSAIFLKKRYRLWCSRPIGGVIKTATFSADARGRWYINVQCEVETTQDCGRGAVGVDLGLKSLAALSDGTIIANPRHFDRHAAALARAQRAKRKARARAIQAKIANCRRDFLHKQSTALVRRYGRIVVGDVNAASMKRLGMGKSVSDASWGEFRNMLRYKAMRHGAEYVDADERYSSQTCSACHARSGPKGRQGLEIRHWVCGECGTVHERDVNAALNILAGAERRPPVEGIAA